MPPHRQWIFFFDCNIKASKVLTIFKMNIWNYPSFYSEEHVSSCCQKRIPLPYASRTPAGLQNFQLNRRKGRTPKPPAQGSAGPRWHRLCVPCFAAPNQRALFPWDFPQAEVQRGHGLDPAVSTTLWLCCWGTSHHWQRCFSRLYLFPSQVISFPLMEKSCNKVAEIPSA